MVAFKKDIYRVIKANKIRFITLISIIAIGICFVTGVGGISNKVKNSFNDYYHSTNVCDIIIKSKKDTGITQSDLEKLNNISSNTSFKFLFSRASSELNKSINLFS